MNKFKVPIKNALFMYSYIWDKIEKKDFTNISFEDDFESSNIYIELFLINIKNSDSSWILAIFINQEVIYTNFYNSFTSSNWTGWKNRNA